MTDWFNQFGGKSQPKESSHDWFNQFGGKSIGQKSERSFGKSALRQAGRIGRAALTGVASIADIPNLPAMGLHAAGLKETPTFYEPIAGKVQQGIDTLTGGAFKAESTPEEYMDIIAEGLAPIVLTRGASLLGNAPGAIGKSAQALSKVGGKAGFNPTAANVAGSVGSSAALKSYLDQGGDPGIVGALLASTAGGAAGRGALKLANPLNTAAETAGWATRFNPKEYAKQTKLGIPVSLGSVSKSEIPKWAELVGAKSLLTMQPIQKLHKSREKAIARNLGVSTPENLVHAVENVPVHLAKKGATGYYNRVENIYKKRNAQFEPRIKEAIKNKETTSVSDLIEKFKAKRENFVSEKAKLDFDKTPDGILLKKLEEYSPTSQIQADADLVRNELQAMKTPDGQPIPQEVINKTVKSNIGEVPVGDKRIGYEDLNLLREKALDESKTLKAPLGEGTMQSAKASIRHGELSKQRQIFIEGIGTPKEVHNARQAHKFWAKYKNEDHGMSKYVGHITGADNDVDAFKRLLDGDQPKYLSIARQGLDKVGREELGHSIIDELGKRQGSWNINTFHTNFLKKGKQWKQQAYRTAFPSKAAKENFTRTMDFVGHNKKIIEKFANTSNTTHTKQFINWGAQIGTATAAAVTGFGFYPLLAVGLEAATLYGGSKIWTSQKFLKRVNDVLTAKTVSGKAHKLDVLYNSINQLGRQSHNLSGNED
jgi:hypothetical protein